MIGKHSYHLFLCSVSDSDNETSQKRISRLFLLTITDQKLKFSKMVPTTTKKFEVYESGKSIGRPFMAPKKSLTMAEKINIVLNKPEVSLQKESTQKLNVK